MPFGWLPRVALVAGLVALLGASSLARADGDPASDVLLAANVFYPYSPAVSASLQRSLDAEAAAAKQARFPIKVALIHSPVDLGAIPELFGKPQPYAAFLDQEISFLGVKQLLLVVMPNGYGARGLSPSATAAVARLKPPAGTSSDDLAQAAIVAVAKLAAAAGHPLGDVSRTSGGGSGSASNTPLVIGVALAAIALSGAVILFRRRAAPRRGSSRR